MKRGVSAAADAQSRSAEPKHNHLGESVRLRVNRPSHLATRLLIAACLGYVAMTSAACSSSLEVRIENHTAVRIPSMSLVTEGESLRESTTSVPALDPGSSFSLQPEWPDGEFALRLVAGGRSYPLMGPVEGDPGGSVDVGIEAQVAGLLTGRVIDKNRHDPQGDFPLKPSP
jgi:hypothetical protein